METRIPNDEYCKHDPIKEGHNPVFQFIEISQMTRNDPKFDLKNSLDLLFNISSLG